MPPGDSPSLWNPYDQSSREEVAESVLEEYSLLESELGSLYLEFDKLTKKAPNNRLSELALQNVNSVISDAKKLLSGDRYVDRVHEFVAAGETPLNSDVLLTLATLKQALSRFHSAWYLTWDELEII